MNISGSDPWPGASSSRSSEWDLSADRTSPAHRHASVMLWVTGAIEAVLFSFIGVIAIAVGMLPVDTLHRLVASEKVNSAQFHEIVKGQSQLISTGAAMLIVLVIPAIALLCLGFAVRRGGWRSNLAARIILYGQCFVIALQLLESVMVASAAPMVLAVIVCGGMLTIMIATLRSLYAARKVAVVAPVGEPWDAD